MQEGVNEAEKEGPMYDLKSKRERFPWFWVILLIVSMLAGVQVIGSIVGTIHKRDVIHIRKQELEGVKRENVALKDQLKRVESQQYIEQQARERLGLGKEGETVILIETPENKGERFATTSSEASKTPWEAWWELLR